MSCIGLCYRCFTVFFLLGYGVLSSFSLLFGIINRILEGWDVYHFSNLFHIS
jgi:hypothetical protein